jgi:hypothetical protein
VDTGARELSGLVFLFFFVLSLPQNVCAFEG